MNIAELTAILGVDVDKKSFAAAERAISSFAAQVQGRIASNASHFSEIVLGTSRAARGAVEDAVVAWDGWNDATKKATKRTFDWGKAAVGAFVAWQAVRMGAALVNDVVQTGDAMDELSQKTGVNVESLQALGYAAGFSDISVDDLGRSLGFLGKNAQMAVDGSKQQSRAFKTLGVDAKKLANGTLPLEDALGTIADKFAGMKDGATKSNLARDLFGKQGVAMIPLLNEGAAGIKRLTDEARAMGIVIRAGDTKALAAFADSQGKLGAQWKGAKKSLVMALLPALRGLVKLLGWVVKGVKALVVAFKFLQDNSRMVFAVLAAMTISLAMYARQAIAAGIASAWAGRTAMWAWIKAAAPLIAMGLAVLAVILVIEDLYQAFTGGDSVLKDLYESAMKWLTWDNIWSALTDGLDAVLGALGDVGAAIADKLGLGTTFLMGEGGQAGSNDWNDKYQAPVNQARRMAAAGGASQVFANAAGLGGFLPTRPATPAGAAGVVNISGGPITVNGGTGDPAEIARQIDVKQREFFDEQMRILKKR